MIVAIPPFYLMISINRSKQSLFLYSFLFLTVAYPLKEHIYVVPGNSFFFLPSLYNVVRQIMLYITSPFSPSVRYLYLKFWKVCRTHWFAWSQHYVDPSWVNSILLSYQSKVCNLRMVKLKYTSAATFLSGARYFIFNHPVP